MTTTHHLVAARPRRVSAVDAVPRRACSVLLLLSLAACGDDAGGGAGGESGRGGSEASGGAGGGDARPAPPEGCTCPDGGGFGCGPDMQCFAVDCGDGVERSCQGPPPCPDGAIAFAAGCPATVECTPIQGPPNEAFCAEPVPCTEAGDPVGACIEPGETCSPALAGCPIPVRVCGDDHVWADGAPITDC